MNKNNNSKTATIAMLQQQQVQEQEQIPEKLIAKFDNDKQLVQEFLGQGYSQEELLKSSILHPTKMDPLCTLENGQHAGIWLYANNSHRSNTGVKYSDDTYAQFLEKQNRNRQRNS